MLADFRRIAVEPATDWVRVTAWATLGLLAVAIVAAVVAIWVARADQSRRRAEATIKIIDDALIRGDGRWEKIRLARKDQSVKELLRTTQDTGVRRAHQELLQDAETLGLGCRLGVYSTDVVWELSRTRLRRLWEYSSTYIDDLRRGEVVGDRRQAQSSAYEHFEWMYLQIQKRDGKRERRAKGMLNRLAR